MPIGEHPPSYFGEKWVLHKPPRIDEYAAMRASATIDFEREIKELNRIIFDLKLRVSEAASDRDLWEHRFDRLMFEREEWHQSKLAEDKPDAPAPTES